ncbi:MAG: secretin N-terminal domain-containing protein [Pseudomonadota bacterium]
MRRVSHFLWVCLVMLALRAPGAQADDTISLALNDVSLAEVMAMLSRQHRVNILLSEGVEGEVSFSLYDTSLDDAIRSISSAAGYAVERRDNSYFIVPHDAAGKYAPDGLTTVRSVEIRYADPAGLEQILTPFLSAYGRLTLAPGRRLLIIEDTPAFVSRIERIIEQLDLPPQQILIEAQILEIALEDTDSFGIDWRDLFNTDGGSGSVGTRDLDSDSDGFFFTLATPEVEASMSALTQRGRVRTLSTPKLLTVQNVEASVVIGDRRGYRVTTTINQITTESIEFLESGVILRVTPNVDTEGRIVMSIEPEVSTGRVDPNGLPSQNTTRVSTRLIVPDGQTIFIGGLMKHTATESTAGVPVLDRIPVVGRLFSNRSRNDENTETIVLITPKIIDAVGKQATEPWNTQPMERVFDESGQLNTRQNRIKDDVVERFGADEVSTTGMTLSTQTTPYTVYLFHAHNKADADSVAAQYADIHTATLDAASQVVVMYGRYSSRQDAQSALEGLPRDLSRFAPSVRRIDVLTYGGS